MKFNYNFTAILSGLLLISMTTTAATFTGVPSGGDWNTPATWTVSGSDPDGVPDANDAVVISSGTVTVSVDNQACNTLTIASGAFLTFSGVDVFTANGYVTLNGTINGTFSGANHCFIKNTSSSGFGGSTGNISITGDLKFFTNALVSTGIVINNTGSIIIGSGFYLGIYGTVTLTGSVDGLSSGSSLKCYTGTVLQVEGKLMATAGTVSTTATAANTTIIFEGSSAYSLGCTTFENVIIRGSGIKTTSGPTTTTFNKTVTIDPGATLAQGSGAPINWNGPMVNNGTFTGSSSNLIYTNASWTNNGTFTHGGNFYFSGSSPKTMSGTGTQTFTSINVQSANVTKAVSTLTINGQLQTIGKDFNNSTGTLTIKGFYLSTSGGTLTANAVGNTVFINYANGGIPITTSGYYNLTLGATATGTKNLNSNTVVANNLTMNSLNKLNTNNFDLSVGGNWLNNSTFTASAGKTVTFNGTSAQTISNPTGTTTFKGLTIDNNAGVTLTTGTYVLEEVLTISNGTFSTGGRPFTMSSTATQTARIAPITGSGAIVGNFTIQRFITARDTTFADFSSPVQSTTFNDWDNELPAISYVYSPPGTLPTGATYDETLDDYVYITSSATSLSPGVGYEFFLSGDFSYASFPATTLTTVGTPNQGDQDLTSLISANVQGWNLVGNPFASSISWASVYTASGGASSGLYDYIEMYDNTIQDWNGYTSADVIEIGSTQGFWVYADFSGPLNLAIPESSKTTASNSTIKASKVTQPYFVLNIATTQGSAAHNFKVAASADALDGFDKKDLPFRASPNKATPALYAMVDGRKINANVFNSMNETFSMPLKTKVNVSGKYKITASGFEFLGDYTCIKLVDNLLGQTFDLTEGNGYCFTMNASDSPDRFTLVMNKDGNNCKSQLAATPSVDFNSQIEILPSAQGNIVNFNLAETSNTNISVLNVLGQTIVEAINVDALNQSVNVALPSDFSGLYFVKVESSKGAITKKFVKK